MLRPSHRPLRSAPANGETSCPNAPRSYLVWTVFNGSSFIERLNVHNCTSLSVGVCISPVKIIHWHVTFISVYLLLLLTLHPSSAWRGVKRWERPLPFLGAGGRVRRLHGTIDTHSQSDQRSRCLSNAHRPYQRESSASFRYAFFICIWYLHECVQVQRHAKSRYLSSVINQWEFQYDVFWRKLDLVAFWSLIH